MIPGPFSAALTGAAMGFSAGVTPGPLLALVIAQTLAHGPREGCKVALAPLLTDTPIVLATLALTASAASHGPILGGITLCGCLFLLWCAGGCLRFAPPRGDPEPSARPGSIGKGMLANLLNPAPYLFWLTVGAPLALQAWGQGAGSAAAFLGAFSLSIVGAKMAVALLTGRFGPVMGGRGYVWVMRLLGLMLLAYAGVFARDAWRIFTS